MALKLRSVHSKPHSVPNDEMQSLIDFGKVEDILDFSVQPVSKTVNQKGVKQHPPKLHKKMVATEAVELLGLKPEIDKYVNDTVQISEYNETGLQ